jgi:hypothetical protein
VLRTLWSVKGGAGVSVTSAGLALVLARAGRSTVLVDLVGDLPAVLGLPDPQGPGWHDWLATSERDPEVLPRLLVPVTRHLRLLPAGRVGAPSLGQGGSDDEAAAASSAVVSSAVVSSLRSLATLAPEVVVDAGRRGVDSAAAVVDADVGRSLLVTRACYLSLRRIVRCGARADSVALVLDAGRALDRRDVADVTGLSVDATIEVDPAVARGVDAGLLVRRPNRSFCRSIQALT